MRIALIVLGALLATSSAQRFSRGFRSGRAFRQGRQQDVAAPISSYGVDIGNAKGNGLPANQDGSVKNGNGLNNDGFNPNGFSSSNGGPNDFSNGNNGDNPFIQEKAVPGEAGEDYPIYSSMPDTAFSCDGQVDGGYYADPEAECQVFHICTADGFGGLAKYSFLCPNGTVFNQEYFICDWWFNFDCAQAQALYGRNDEIRAEQDANADSSSFNDGERIFSNGENTFTNGNGLAPHSESTVSVTDTYGAP